MKSKTPPNSPITIPDSPKCELVINLNQFTDNLKQEKTPFNLSIQNESTASPFPSPKSYRVGGRSSRSETGTLQLWAMGYEKIRSSRSSVDMSKIDPKSQHETPFEKKTKTHERGSSR